MILRHGIPEYRPQLAQVLRIRNSLTLYFVDDRINNFRSYQVLAETIQLSRPGDSRGRLLEIHESLRELVDVDELVEFPDAYAKDVRRARGANQINKAARHHLLFLGVPLLALTVDVNPRAQPLLLR